MAKDNITVKGTRLITGEEARRYVALCESLRRCLHRQ
jgi:hypothetical protein